MPLILTESDVRKLLPLDELRRAMAEALTAFSTGAVEQPLRTVLPIGPQAFMAVMPALIPGARALGTKLVTLVAGNVARGIPTHLATIVMTNAETGELEAIMDGRYITEARTAAVSAVATEHLGREVNASVLGLLGSGVQARSHLEALVRVRAISEARVWSPNTERCEHLVEAMRDVAPVRVAADAEGAVRDADLIALVTSATQPVIRSEWVRDGAHIVAVGACRPDQQEMDPALVARARLFVDSREGAFAEAGDIVLALRDGLIDRDHVVGELGEVIAGRVDGRGTDNEVTIFKSLGMAVEDVAAARLVVQRARVERVGRELDLD